MLILLVNSTSLSSDKLSNWWLWSWTAAWWGKSCFLLEESPLPNYSCLFGSNTSISLATVLMLWVLVRNELFCTIQVTPFKILPFTHACSEKIRNRTLGGEEILLCCISFVIRINESVLSPWLESFLSAVLSLTSVVACVSRVSRFFWCTGIPNDNWLQHGFLNLLWCEY